MALALCFICLLPLMTSSTLAQTDSPVQSPARPFGLDIVDTVKLSGSDASSADFQSNFLPTFQAWSSLNLTRDRFTKTTSAIALDPAKLNLATAYDVRTYFITENTTFHNTLGFNTGGGSITTGDPLLIFPDASSRTARSNINNPLKPGDFVDIGSFGSGTQLDFFLIADGARGGTDIYSTQTSVNPDGLQHVLAFAVPDSPYLLLGFEDLHNTNQNFKDLLFAVDIGFSNVAALASVPEPSLLIISTSFLCFALYKKRRQDISDKRKAIS